MVTNHIRSGQPSVGIDATTSSDSQWIRNKIPTLSHQLTLMQSIGVYINIMVLRFRRLLGWAPWALLAHNRLGRLVSSGSLRRATAIGMLNPLGSLDSARIIRTLGVLRFPRFRGLGLDPWAS